jgi:putative nucleotidyltransferase-like protein
VGERSPLVSLTRRLASYGLAGASGFPLDVPEASTDGFLSALLAQRLTGLGMAAWEAGQLGLSQSGALLASQREVMFSVLGIERRLLRVVADFEEEGIDVLILKGPAVAHTLYPDPAWRPFGDIDLLVRTSDWEAACAVLERQGSARLVPEPRPGFDTRFGKGAEYRCPDGLEVDLHRTLVVGPFGLWLDPDELFLHSDTFLLGGRRLRRLEDTAIMLHACLHAILGPNPPLLMPLRDVAQAMASGSIDWNLLREWAVRWNLGPVLARAFGTVEEALEVPVPGEARSISMLESPRRARKALEASFTERAGGPAVATLRAIPGIRAKAAYARTLLFPGRAFLTSRSGVGERPSYVRRWLKPVRWLRGGTGGP